MERIQKEVAPRWQAPYKCYAWYIGGEPAWCNNVKMVKNERVTLETGDEIKSAKCTIEYERRD